MATFREVALADGSVMTLQDWGDTPVKEKPMNYALAKQIRLRICEIASKEITPIRFSTSSAPENPDGKRVLLVRLFTHPDQSGAPYTAHVYKGLHDAYSFNICDNHTGQEVYWGSAGFFDEEKEKKPSEVEEKRRPILGDPEGFNFEEGMVVELTNDAVAWHLHRLAAGYKLKNYVEGAEVMAGARGTVEQVLRHHTHPSTGEDEHLLAVSIDGISFLVPARYVRSLGQKPARSIEEKKAALGKAYGATDSVIQPGGKDPFPIIREEIPKDRKAPWMFHSFVFRLPDGKQIESPHVEGAIHKEDIPYDPWVPAVVESGDENHLMVCGVTSAPFRIDFSRPEVKCWAKDMVPILVGEQAHLVTWRVWQAPPEEKEDTCSGNTIREPSLW